MSIVVRCIDADPPKKKNMLIFFSLHFCCSQIKRKSTACLSKKKSSNNNSLWPSSRAILIWFSNGSVCIENYTAINDDYMRREKLWVEWSQKKKKRKKKIMCVCLCVCILWWTHVICCLLLWYHIYVLFFFPCLSSLSSFSRCLHCTFGLGRQPQIQQLI